MQGLLVAGSGRRAGTLDRGRGGDPGRSSESPALHLAFPRRRNIESAEPRCRSAGAADPEDDGAGAGRRPRPTRLGRRRRWERPWLPRWRRPVAQARPSCRWPASTAAMRSAQPRPGPGARVSRAAARACSRCAAAQAGPPGEPTAWRGRGRARRPSPFYDRCATRSSSCAGAGRRQRAGK